MRKCGPPFANFVSSHHKCAIIILGSMAFHPIGICHSLTITYILKVKVNFLTLEFHWICLAKSIYVNSDYIQVPFTDLVGFLKLLFGMGVSFHFH